MIVGSVPDPLNWDRWPQAEAFLEPARARGGFPSCLEPDEVLFAVMDGDELLAVATASRRQANATGEIYVEVALVGGRDHRRWISELNDHLGAEASRAGATRLVAIGRVGWTKVLRRIGWVRCQPVEDHWLFERKLGEHTGE